LSPCKEGVRYEKGILICQEKKKKKILIAKKIGHPGTSFPRRWEKDESWELHSEPTVLRGGTFESPGSRQGNKFCQKSLARKNGAVGEIIKKL